VVKHLLSQHPNVVKKELRGLILVKVQHVKYIELSYCAIQVEHMLFTHSFTYLLKKVTGKNKINDVHILDGLARYFLVLAKI
jgi:hypothetical protein